MKWHAKSNLRHSSEAIQKNKESVERSSTSVNLNRLGIERTTAAVLANKEAIEATTQAILRNAQAVESSTELIAKLHIDRNLLLAVAIGAGVLLLAPFVLMLIALVYLNRKLKQLVQKN